MANIMPPNKAMKQKKRKLRYKMIIPFMSMMRTGIPEGFSSWLFLWKI